MSIARVDSAQVDSATQPARSDASAEGPAKILTGDAVLSCRLRPEGSAAARLSLPSAVGIPELFVLSDEASGDERLARVTCRKQGADGARLWVQFLGPTRLAA